MGYKLVLDEQSETVVIGVGKDGCDPKTYKVLNADDGKDGCLWALEAPDRWATAVANLPKMIADAEGKWEIDPRNPKYVAPAKKTPAKAKGPDPATPAPAATATATADPPTDELPLLDDGQSEEATMTNPEPQEPQEDTQEPQDGDQEPQTAQETAEPPADPEEAAQQAEAATENAHPWVTTEPVAGPALSSVDQATAVEAPAEPETSETPAEPETPETPAPAATADAGNGGAWRYYVDGVNTNAEGYATVHEALLTLGVTQADIDAHKYWHRHDRLPKVHADRIRKEHATG